jgi:uracil-DNA glycosylase
MVMTGTNTRWIEDGSPSSPLWLVGEAPGENEDRLGKPFMGASGRELDALLHEAGLHRSDCFLTNVCHDRPPPYTDKHGKVIHNDIEQFFANRTQARAEQLQQVHNRFPREPITRGLRHLQEQLDRFHPHLILALGNTPLWALCGVTGITKWRGSLLDGARPDGAESGPAVLPTFHPADILPNRSPHHRPILLHDLERANRVLREGGRVAPPAWDFTIPTSIREVEEWFAATAAQQPLACDIETRGGQIACIGFASSATRAICIPFMRVTPSDHGYSYWSVEQEQTVVNTIASVLLTAPLVFHNGLFDCQYLAKQWGLFIAPHDDTMVMQHVAFPGFLGGKIDPVSGKVDKRGSSLSLSFIASMYCSHYRFWKDDGRLFDPTEHDEQQFWNYNCEDCCRTHECFKVLQKILLRDNLTTQYRLEMSLFPLTFRMMFRGMAVNRERMAEQHSAILRAKRDALAWLREATGVADFNPESTPQMRALFYDDLHQPIRRKKHTGAPTLDDTALASIAVKTPVLQPLIVQIQTFRTLDTIKDDVDVARLSTDGRLRCAFNPAYVETMRYSSNETAFGEGGNLQNLPRPPED